MSDLGCDIAASQEAAMRLMRAYAVDPDGYTATPIVQQVISDFETTHVLIALGVLTGILVRLIGPQFPGGVDGLIDTIVAVHTATTPEGDHP